MWRQKKVSFSPENRVEENILKRSERQIVGILPHSKSSIIPTIHHQHLQNVSCSKKCSSVLTASYGSLGQLEVNCTRSSFIPLPTPQMPSLRSLVCRNRTQQSLQTALPDAVHSHEVPRTQDEIETPLKRDVSCTSLNHCKAGHPVLSIRKCETAMGLSSLAMDEQSQKSSTTSTSNSSGSGCPNQNSKGAQVHRPLNRRDRECRRPFVSSRNIITRELSASTRNLLMPLRREFSASCTSTASSSFASPSATSPLLLLPSSGREHGLSIPSEIDGPMKPINRLRMSCSRCSSLASLSASRLSLGVSPPQPPLQTVPQEEETFEDATDGISKLESAESADDKNKSGSNLGLTMIMDYSESGISIEVPVALSLCKLCLTEDVKGSKVFKIQQCGCLFCQDCMTSYVEFEIQEGAYDISCPDSQCPTQGVISMTEIESLVRPDLTEKHRRFRLYREVDLDVRRVWCPAPGCETVCTLPLPPSDSSASVPPCEPSNKLQTPFCKCPPQRVVCPTCSHDFCSACRKPSHVGVSCEVAQLWSGRWGGANQGAHLLLPPGVPPDSELIKCCPMCCVPIEKDEGCAQMMCKRCKHVFCWYCLTSLDDDFLLRHYDKGPCKNKLGHSRASVIWHRAQVIGIFAGFGILLLVASPLLLLAAPCILCCKCRVCTGAAVGANGEKLEEEEDDDGGGAESIGIVAGKVAAHSLKSNAAISDNTDLPKETS